MYFLAANPEVQDWMSEEIRAVFGDRPQHEWTASADFPRLKRCIAVLFETLRLYLPVVSNLHLLITPPNSCAFPKGSKDAWFSSEQHESIIPDYFGVMTTS